MTHKRAGLGKDFMGNERRKNKIDKPLTTIFDVERKIPQESKFIYVKLKFTNKIRSEP